MYSSVSRLILDRMTEIFSLLLHKLLATLAPNCIFFLWSKSRIENVSKMSFIKHKILKPQTIAFKTIFHLPESLCINFSNRLQLLYEDLKTSKNISAVHIFVDKVKLHMTRKIICRSCTC